MILVGLFLLLCSPLKHAADNLALGNNEITQKSPCYAPELARKNNELSGELEKLVSLLSMVLEILKFSTVVTVGKMHLLPT